MQPNTENLLIIFVGLTGIAVLLQACVLLGIYISLRKTAALLSQTSEDMKATVLPTLHSTRELLEKISPQVVVISSGIAELTQTVQSETRAVRVSVSDIVDRVTRQTARLDSMVTSSLNSVEKAGSVLESAVAVPVRQANGIMAAVKAVVETYRHTAPRRSPEPAAESNLADFARAARKSTADSFAQTSERVGQAIAGVKDGLGDGFGTSAASRVGGQGRSTAQAATGVSDPSI